MNGSLSLGLLPVQFCFRVRLDEFISMLTNGKELAAVCTPVLITIDFNMTLNTMLECMEFCFKQISTK